MNQNPKIPVYAIHLNCDRPPIGLGLIISYLKTKLAKKSIERLNFAPGYIVSATDFDQALTEYQSGIFLFSTFIWNSTANLKFSQAIKEAFKDALIIFGGPFIPREEKLAIEFKKQYPHIDVLCHGEGEETVYRLLQNYLDGNSFDGIQGITYSKNGSVLHTGITSMENLSEIPSPYLTGEFDDFVKKHKSTVISFETTRGCPYKCAFCDWGQATSKKIREFSLERIYQELEWVGRNKIAIIELTDSNFGILDRDVKVGEFICQVRDKYDYPKELCANFSKNVHDNVVKIIKMTKDSGLVSQAILSIQTLNPETLKIIGRKNLNEAHYGRSLRKFRELNLPVTVELMLGLPECTVTSFKNDLQWSCDNNLGVYVHSTLIIPNTEIATKEYKEKYKIVTAIESKLSDPQYLEQIGLKSIRDNQVISLSSISELEFISMLKFTAVFHIFYGESLIKYILFFLQHKYGIKQIEFLHSLQKCDLKKYPLLMNVRDMGDSPASTISFAGDEDVVWNIVVKNQWADFYGELLQYITDSYHIPIDEELQTVRDMQQFVMAYYKRRLPEERAFKYDFPAYFKNIIMGNSGAPLIEYRGCVLRVTDPLKICAKEIKPDYYEPHHGHIELASQLNSLRFGFDLNEIVKK